MYQYAPQHTWVRTQQKDFPEVTCFRTHAHTFWTWTAADRQEDWRLSWEERKVQRLSSSGGAPDIPVP